MKADKNKKPEWSSWSWLAHDCIPDIIFSNPSSLPPPSVPLAGGPDSQRVTGSPEGIIVLDRARLSDASCVALRPPRLLVVPTCVAQNSVQRRTHVLQAVFENSERFRPQKKSCSGRITLESCYRVCSTKMSCIFRRKCCRQLPNAGTRQAPK